MIQGTCLCGTLRYEIDGPLTSMMNCHCSMCRKQHGAAFATYAVAPLAGFRWIAGEDEVVRYQSSAQGSRAFCRRCGSVAPGAFPSMGIVFAPAGNLGGELGRHPEGHMFVGSKAPWYAITDHLPQHEVYPPGFPAEGVPRPQSALREGVTEGRCLCGKVAYEIRGEPLRMMNCHCATVSAAGSGGVRHTRRTCSTRSTRSASRAASRRCGSTRCRTRSSTPSRSARTAAASRPRRLARHRSRHPADGAHLRREQGPLVRHHRHATAVPADAARAGLTHPRFRACGTRGSSAPG